MTAQAFDAQLIPDGTSFHAQNALFFAHLSDVIYKKRQRDVEAITEPWGLELNQWTWKNQGPTHVAVWSTPKHILTVFRGTDEKADWGDNLRIGRLPHDFGRVHSGFAGALARVECELLAVLTGLLTEKPRKLWIAGHSLGGALATLMATKLVLANASVEGVYTFGQPQVGDRKFVRHYNKELGKRTYRVVNHLDAVAYLLRTQFKHVDTLVQLGNTSGYRVGGPNRPDRAGFPRSRPGGKGPRRFNRNNALSKPDHAMSRYVGKLSAILDAELGS